MKTNDQGHRAILGAIARRAMLERGLLPDFSPAVLAELRAIRPPAASDGQSVRDLRNLLWASIDNDDSRDLDQLTVGQAMPGDEAKVLVAVADVDELVSPGSAIDGHARHNTTSVYTPGKVFPMLPEELSTDLTSLNPNGDRLSIVIEMVIGADGRLVDSEIYRALVRNHAKLAYDSVAAWLEGTGPVPDPIGAVEGLADNLRLQDKAARTREEPEARPGRAQPGDRGGPTGVRGRHHHPSGSPGEEPRQGSHRGLHDRGERRDRAVSLVETPALPSAGWSAVRQRWDRIVDIAGEHGFKLPAEPDSEALEEFLAKERAADPLRFPDLSLTVIKLLGAGEYTAEPPDGAAPGHFGLAVKDYAHSTAPNRRYSDLLTQRLLKAAIAGERSPYSAEELTVLAAHCSRVENIAEKVERQVGKSAAALLLQSRIGEEFEALVTGAAAKGTWVRLLNVPVEGKLTGGFEGVDVGDRVRARLISVDVALGHLDFERAT